MNKYLKAFLQRGLMFGGFGPIVAGIVFFAISCTTEDFSIGGGTILLAILSTYFLAFIQAGISVFNQIESWSVARSLLCHFAMLYVAYVGCYLANAWIPFDWMVVAIFTAIFVVLYAIIWITVFLSVRAVSKRLNKRLG